MAETRIAPITVDPSDFSLEQLNVLASACLKAKDFEGFIVVLRIMAVRFPDAAQTILDAVDLAVAVSS